MRRFKKMCYCLGICMILILCGGCKTKETAVLHEITEEDTEEKKEENPVTVQFVYVCGAVVKPGVYELPEGGRMYEALEAAGGMTEEADQTYLNQAELLEDGQRIYVPTQKETASENQGNDADMAENDGKINLNTATKEELMTLAGIGESKARSIIKYREENGRFHSVEDIMKIEGIKSGVFNKIKDQIVVK